MQDAERRKLAIQIRTNNLSHWSQPRMSDHARHINSTRIVHTNKQIRGVLPAWESIK